MTRMFSPKIFPHEKPDSHSSLSRRWPWSGDHGDDQPLCAALACFAICRTSGNRVRAQSVTDVDGCDPAFTYCLKYDRPKTICQPGAQFSLLNGLTYTAGNGDTSTLEAACSKGVDGDASGYSHSTSARRHRGAFDD